MNKLRDPRVRGALRHLLTAIGPVIAVVTAADDPVALLGSLFAPQNWTALVGMVMAALGFWASWTAPEKQTTTKAV